MIGLEVVTKNGYVKVDKIEAKTENKLTSIWIITRFENLRSCHPYDEQLLEFLVRKLKQLN